MDKASLLSLLVGCFFISNSSQAQNATLDSIKTISSVDSIMKTVSYFSDVYGPRFLGTPDYYSAINYAKNKLEDQGLKTELQNFDRGYRGWDISSFNIEMSHPKFAPITAFPLAFTKSTNGEKEGELVFIDNLKEGYSLEGNLKGKIIMLKALYRPVTSFEGTLTKRLSDETLWRARANSDPNDVIIGYHSRVSVAGLFKWRRDNKKRLESFYRFLEKEGVVAVIEPSDRPYTLLHVDGNRAMPSFKLKDDYKPIATFTISNEHFGRLLRLNNLGFKPKLKVELTSRYYTETEYHQNLIAEIPGTDPDLKDELVIIGGHLDSWHAGTGAVDNGASCAMLMESMRILKALDVKPKRTIRMVFWGGEEHVFAGSEFYTDTRIGDMKTGEPRFEKPKISTYLNIDNGAGKIRGIYLMGNKAIEPYFAKFLQPFPESNSLVIQNANQTDHWILDYHNIPSFQFIQDPLDYLPAIHHTNSDVYEYVHQEEQKYNAELVAYLALQIANEKELLPRKPYNFIQPSREGNVVFKLEGFKDAENVSVVGDFNSWDMFNLPMYKTEDGWEMKLDL
ncbi:MAG: M20/M25/M40 family metallo-hydrolase, partial [Bacteroidota bacterium]